MGPLWLRTPRIRSPYGYFQERYRDEPWQLLCCVIMLNQTSGEQLEAVHGAFFEAFPAPGAISEALVAPGVYDLARGIVRPLGLAGRRTLALARMSHAFVERPPRSHLDVREMPGCGRYASESYMVFVDGLMPSDAQVLSDKELRRYVEWAAPIAAADELVAGGQAIGLYL